MAYTPYTTGTVSLSAGGTVVTGVGTNWLSSGIAAGDDFRALGLDIRIASVDTNTQITLAKTWPGAALGAGSSYEVYVRPEGVRNLTAALAVLQSLTNGILSAFSGLSPVADRLAYFTGAGTMGLITFLAWARTFLGAADITAARAALGANDAANLSTGTLPDARLPARLSTSAATITDWNTVLTSGFYKSAASSGANAPNGSNNFFGEVLCYDSANGIQRIWAQGSVRLAYERRFFISTVVVFTSWVEIPTLETAQTYAGKVTIAAAAAASGQDTFFIRPTDFGSGKPYMSVVHLGAASYLFNLWDGVTTAGTFTFRGTLFKAEGAYAATTASAANVNVASDGTLARSTSSEKYKTNIEPMSNELADKILEMEPIWYRSTCDLDDPTWSWWGLSAEAVAKIDPRLVHWKTYEMVTTIEDRIVEEEVDGEIVSRTEQVPVATAIALDTPEPEGVAYERLTVFLINMVKRIWAWQSSAQAEICGLQSQIEALEARLSALEAQ